MKEYQGEPVPMPKQMRHWFEKAGIYPSRVYGLHRKWRKHQTLYGGSRKKRFTQGTRDAVRYFRVLPHVNLMEICDGYFDRWANSTGAVVPMPKTEAEFNNALDLLVKRSKRRVAETHRGL